MTFEVRTMREHDVPACAAIINHTISLGGSTAHEDPFDVPDFSAYYFQQPDAANVVLLDDRVVGFQAVFKAEPGVYSIGSFTDRQNPARGAGAAMFAKTLADCRALKGSSIIAKITEDNTAGLKYYSEMGFQDDFVKPADHTRPDGKVVDRIVKRFVL